MRPQIGKTILFVHACTCTCMVGPLGDSPEGFTDLCMCVCSFFVSEYVYMQEETYFDTYCNLYYPAFHLKFIQLCKKALERMTNNTEISQRRTLDTNHH